MEGYIAYTHPKGLWKCTHPKFARGICGFDDPMCKPYTPTVQFLSSYFQFYTHLSSLKLQNFTKTFNK